MIKNQCPKCGYQTPFTKAVLASKTVPVSCKSCGIKLFRSHQVTKTWAYLGGSLGLIALILILMANGLRAAVYALLSYSIVLTLAYIGELFKFCLIELDDEQRKNFTKKSQKNILIVFVIIVLGAKFYILDV